MKPTLLLLASLATFVAAGDGTCQTQEASQPGHEQQTRATIVNRAFTHLQLAKQARKDDKIVEMWRQLDKAIKVLPTDRNAPVARQLRDFLATTEPFFLGGNSAQMTHARRVEALLLHARLGHQPSKAAAIVELLVRLPRVDSQLQQHARKSPSIARRLAALAALDRRPAEENHRFVLRTAVIDRNESVRKEVLDIVRPDATAEDINYLASGLGHSSPKVRMRTAEALGNLGDLRAIDILVKAGPAAASGLKLDGGGAQTRGHVAFLRQTSYIRDFDVEVASAAFIADPKVDVLQEGSVLDATVMGVQQVRTIRRYYRRALKQLSGSDPGQNVKLWADKMAKAKQNNKLRYERIID